MQENAILILILTNHRKPGLLRFGVLQTYITCFYRKISATDPALREHTYRMKNLSVLTCVVRLYWIVVYLGQVL